MHGRFEDADANFFIPRTSIPADFAMGLTGVGLAFFDMFGRADEDVLNFANGVLSGATAMYFRKHALAGKQASKFWAGAPELMAPVTHNHPSIGCRCRFGTRRAHRASSRRASSAPWFRRRPAPRDREAMEVLVNLGDVPLLKRSRFLGLFIKPLLDALVVVNGLFLRAHHVDPLYQSGVRYQQEPPDGKPEEFAAIPMVLSRGWGDCDDLAPWRVAELQEDGEKAKVRVSCSFRAIRTHSSCSSRSHASGASTTRLTKSRPRRSRSEPCSTRPGRCMTSTTSSNRPAPAKSRS